MSMPTQFPPISLALRPGTTDLLALGVGQTISARVLGPAADGGTLVRIGVQQLTLQLPTPPAAGTVLHLRLEGRTADGRMTLSQLAPALTPTAPAQADAGAALKQFSTGGSPTPAAESAAAARSSTQAPTDPTRLALTQMVQSALGRQGNIASLFTTIAALGPVAGHLPEPVRRLLGEIAPHTLRLGETPMAARNLQQAVRTSGIFQEALLSTTGNAGAVQGELKGQLLALAEVLRRWLGNAPTGALPVNGPPPPMRGVAPRAAKTPVHLAPSPETGEEAGRRLLDDVEAALSRVRLLQNASLPDEAGRAASVRSEWNLDLPFVYQGQFGVLPFQIQADEGGSQAEGERGWRVRFAMDLGQSGQVGAQISLHASRASAMLWATEDAMAQAIEDALPELAGMLADAGLAPGTLICRRGRPDSVGRSSGGIVDATS
ncbi:flagellar hook-length control protein FliK [Devosia nitrariae]|nr:flagellar hook-length control protein FliK [Devosia nitrariae]